MVNRSNFGKLNSSWRSRAWSRLACCWREGDQFFKLFHMAFQKNSINKVIGIISFWLCLTLSCLNPKQYVNHNLNFIKILWKFAYENIGKESHTLPSLTVWQLNYMLIVGWQLKDWFFLGKIIVTFCIGTKVCLRLYWNKNQLTLT